MIQPFKKSFFCGRKADEEWCKKCKVCKYQAWLEWAESVAPSGSTIQRDPILENVIKNVLPILYA